VIREQGEEEEQIEELEDAAFSQANEIDGLLPISVCLVNICIEGSSDRSSVPTFVPKALPEGPKRQNPRNEIGRT